MRKSGLTGDEAYALSKRRGTSGDLDPLKKELSLLKEDLDNKITKFYASNQGETHLVDSDNGKIMDMMVYGKSEQKQYSGKNLLSPVLKSQTTNGITCVDNGNGTYTFTGTATNKASFKVYGSDSVSSEVLKEFTNKKIVGCPPGGGSGKYFLRASDNITYAYTDFGQGAKITTDIRYIYIRFEEGVTVSGLIFKPMIIDDLDATYDDFEPYTGGQSSPSPDYPQEINSIVNPTVKVTNEDETKFHTVTLPYTLNAIPVSSGGNVTIDGQQYIADYVNVERGKLVKMVDSSKLDNTQSIVNKTEWLLAEPQEIDLTKEEIAAFKALTTYYPTTNISINSKQLGGYTVFNYPISMANGWNYVKQQIGDTREYIYDIDTRTQNIDTQAAEAYVNSEYAVALTELEV